jgi:hypothetical protein
MKKCPLMCIHLSAKVKFEDDEKLRSRLGIRLKNEQQRQIYCAFMHWYPTSIGFVCQFYIEQEKKSQA